MTKPKGTNVKAGFSLIELLVVIAIIIILVGATVANYRGFERKTVLNNLAQDIGLSIRLAQSYGLTVRSGDADGFQISYGIRFQPNTTNYFIYKDRDRGGGVEGFGYKGVAQIVERYELSSGYRISDVCINTGSGYNCSISTIDIVFDRPKPDAIINNGAGEAALIEVEDPEGNIKHIEVLLTGFISTQ